MKNQLTGIVRSRFVSVVAGLLAAAVLVSCGRGPDISDNSGSAGSAAGEAAGAKRWTLAVIPKGMVHEFWKSVEAGVRQAAEEFSVDIRWEGPTNETEHDRQRSIVESMIGMGVDGLALAPTDEKALVRPVQSASRRGIPVVIYDSNLDAQQGTDFLSFVATDNEKGGRLAGEHMVQRLAGQGGRVALLRYTEGSGSTLRREQGFIDAIAASNTLELADQQYTDGTTAGAMSTATNMLSRFVSDNVLEINGIFASNLATSLGMQGALQRLRKQGVRVDVVFVGFDASEQLLAGLESQEIDALVVQNPRRMGFLAVETLVRHLRGEPVEPYIDTGVELVTKERLQDAAIRELLGI